MLTNRQFQLLNYYVEHRDTYIPTQKLASLFDISIRTVKNELKTIKEFSQDYSSFQLETVSNKGTKVAIHDDQLLKKELDLLQKEVEGLTDNVQYRLNAMIKLLLDSQKYVPKYLLYEQFFISESTLYKYMNEIKKILTTFNLKLSYKTNLGYLVIGEELDKRMCLARIGISDEGPEHLSASDNTTKIYNIIADTFIKYQYHVNEQTIQNITAHLSRTLERLKKHHYITSPSELDFSQTTEFTIANNILAQLIYANTLDKTYYLNEVTLLTQIILGKLDYNENEQLQEEINDFISTSFELINKKFFINLDSIENLKLLLALHLVPLFYRARSGTQLVNSMAPEIHQSFPQAYDIALFFIMLIKKEFGLVISGDEISYITLYFNYGLENYSLTTDRKRLLVITPLRKSETILLKHKILKWFPNQIEEINFVYPDFDDIDLENYDAIFSTEEQLEKYQGGVNYISLFPSEKDFKKINLAINGYTDIHSIVEKFSEECFFHGSADSKEDVINIVTNNAIKYYQLENDFVEIIKDREKITSSYFGNGVAMPHPLSPVTEDTFVSVAILDKPLDWDARHKVQFVMLVSIAKNNPKEFQFWHYLSAFTRNENILEKVIKNPTYKHFLKMLKLSLKKEFDK